MFDMRRREFMSLLGGAATAWPLAARGQQPAMPVIGYLGAQSPAAFASRVRAFRQGLAETRYVEARNVAIEFRWAEGQHDRLPSLAAELVGRPVAVIVAPGGAPAALAAKSATTTTPIVFEMGADPIATGLVGSLARPGGNLTGVTSLNVQITPKRLEILHEVVPTAAVIAVLLNVVASDTFFATHSEQLAALTVRHAVPAIHQSRDFAIAGGLMSYAGDFLESHRQAGIILKGEKPADLPVQQVTKVELFINLKTAKTLGMTFPLSLLGRADQVIE
jgi:putative tryptophan/tyrosine transport system substrate-binding protein